MRVNSSLGKQDTMKKASLLNKRNPMSTSVEKLKKTQRELKHNKKNKNNTNTFKAKLLKAEIWLKMDNHD